MMIHGQERGPRYTVHSSPANDRSVQQGDDLAQQIVIGPSEKLHLGDQLGPHPMHAAEHEWRSKTAAARRHLDASSNSTAPTSRILTACWRLFQPDRDPDAGP